MSLAVTGGALAAEPPGFILAAAPKIVIAGGTYQAVFRASGRPTYTIVNAPSWLSIDPATGVVSGTPPTGTTSFSYIVSATNQFGSSATGACTRKPVVSNSRRSRAELFSS